MYYQIKQPLKPFFSYCDLIQGAYLTLITSDRFKEE